MTDINKECLSKMDPDGYLGVDTGGTFTDFYWCGARGDIKIHKVLSTPLSPEQAILQGIKEMGLASVVKLGSVVIVHGSTVATNAALERKGVKTAFVTNKGFADMLSLGRQNRDDIYALNPEPLVDPVPPDLCVEVDCRVGSKGEVLTPMSDAELQRVCEKLVELSPEAVAINFLFSYLNGDDERRLAEALPSGMFVCCSSDVLPEYKEYERGMATWLNAWLGPKVEKYIQRLQKGVHPSLLSVMQSSGGTIAAEQANRKAVNLLLSGPAGGLAAAKYIGAQLNKPNLLTFDMGGTSTDVALIEGDIKLTSEGRLGAYPVAVPMVDMHTIGAGGGSIAYIDDGGMLHVGPESSGASPGPACYGVGGMQATVTDANAVLGRLRPNHFLGGRMTLDLAAAQNVVGKLAEQMGVTLERAAEGVIALANEHMARALRVISVQKGHDPSEFDLCCFGGAGGLHVCALAEELGVSRILIPANGGVLSAFGMLVAPKQRQLSKTVTSLLNDMRADKITEIAQGLLSVGRKELSDEGVSGGLKELVSVDCRYQGQSFSLNVEFEGEITEVAAKFHKKHELSYGHELALPVEIVNVRVSVEAEGQSFVPDNKAMSLNQCDPTELVSLVSLGDASIWNRSSIAFGQVIRGPAIICEDISTTLVLSGWESIVDECGHLHLSRIG